MARHVSTSARPRTGNKLLSRSRRPIVAAVMAVLVATVAAGAAVGTPQQSKGVKIDRNATLTVAVLGPTPTLDPHALPNSMNLTLNLWDRLTTFDGKGRLKPMIALSWAFSKDKKSMTFKLRRGVKFHDGTPLDATAVKASIDRARTAPRATAPQLPGVASVDVVDAATIRVNLAFGGAELPQVLAGNTGAIINPKCIADNTPLLMMPDNCTSGAWTLTSGTPPQEWNFKRWTGKYWDPNAFKFANLKSIISTSSQIAMNAMVAGDVDIAQITTEGLPQARDLVKSGQLKGKFFSANSTLAMMLSTRRPPFDNILLRRAVQASIDPKAIGNQYFAGNCPPTVQPASGIFFDPKFNPNPYNPDRAKQLLAQAGVPNGFTFTNTVPNIALTIGASQVIQDQLAKVGIKMELAPVTGTTAPPLVQGTAQATVSSMGNGVDPALAIGNLFVLGEGRLATAVGSPVEKQLDTLRYRALDPSLTAAQRGKVYQKIWKVMYDQAITLPICRLGLIWPHRTNILNADYLPFAIPYSIGNDVRYVSVASK